MKKKIRKFVIYLLKNYSFCLGAYNTFYKIKNRDSYQTEISKRSNMGIFDFQLTMLDLPYYPVEKIRDTNMFGHIRAIKKYSDIKNIPNILLEHGLMYGSFVNDYYSYGTIRSILTFSNHRANNIRRKIGDKDIIPIGPYIHYATPFYSDNQFAELKRQLGKTLVVFWAHSETETKRVFDETDFLNIVKDVSKEFDTVLVNVFYHDLLNKHYPLDLEKKYGFKIVSAGNRYDPYFVNRLRSIIQLADYTMSNSIGTHIGYCIYLKKPHYVYFQDMSLEVASKNKDLAYTIKEDRISKEHEFNEILNVFSKKSKVITQEQYDIAAKYWGFNCVKSKTELSSLLKNNYLNLK